jgi:Pathogenicity locus
MPAATAPSALTAIPNVGPAVARKLLRLDIRGVEDLRGRDADELFERLCAMEGRRLDPCLLDTFTAAVAYADGGPARPWWEFSRARKAAAAGR